MFLAPNIVADVSEERLNRYFTLDANGSYRIEKSIRDLVIFAEQDLLKDPPFSKLNLISCRNLLIYLNGELQKRLIDLFHYALAPGGMLFLGNSESIGDAAAMFEPLDRKAKLYLRKTDTALPLAPLVRALPHLAVIQPKVLPVVLKGIGSAKKNPSLREITEQALLHDFTRAAVLVDAQGEILYFHGRTGKYLEPAVGDAVSNVLGMARQGLDRSLRAALHRAVANSEVVYIDSLEVKTNGHYVFVNLTILPIGSPTAAFPALFLVIFDEKPERQIPAQGPAKLPADGKGSVARIAALEHQLRSKDNYIQTIVEEMETSGEELKSANEEMQSVNEEMQSTNEELETSREELQSVNEELVTVNAELLQKVAQLSRANNDMNNLLAGTGVGTVFVDLQLRVTRFTPSVTEVLNLIQSDVDRPLAHIATNLVGYDHLLADVQAVLDTLVPLEAEVQIKTGKWFILSIRPYRTLENVIEGAVISFVDVTARKASQQKQVELERFRHAAHIETVGIAFFRFDGVITAANEAFLHMLDYSREDLDSGKVTWEAITPSEWLPHSRKALRELKTTGKATPFEMQYLRKDESRGKALFAEWRLDEGEAVVYVISMAPEM